MVRDGYWYAISLLFVAAVVRFFTADWFASWVLVRFLCCSQHFFSGFSATRTAIPAGPGLVVSPADGKITEVAPIHTPDGDRIRLSIFLNVFDVHVNRSPIAGTIRSIQYKKGEYLNAMDPASAERNEQSVVMMEGEGCIISLKLIAGLLARRIVFVPKEGDILQRGERVGLIKFGSRCDLISAWGCAYPRRARTAGQRRREHPGGRRSALPRTEAAEGSHGDAPVMERKRPRRRGMFVLPSLFTAATSRPATTPSRKACKDRAWSRDTSTMPRSRSSLPFRLTRSMDALRA